MKKLHLSLFFIGFACATSLHAQDAEFTQTMGSPMYFNPAFTGIQQNLRAGLQIRDQWPSVSGSFITTLVSADMGFTKIHSGVGLQLEQDQAGDGNLTTRTIGLSYAYEIKLSPSSYIRLAASPSVFWRTIDFSKLRFGYQIDPKTGFIDSAGKYPAGNNITRLMPDLALGAVYYDNRFYAGLAVYHIWQPNQSFFNNANSMLLRKYDLQAGYFINAGSFVINPYMLGMVQGNFAQILPGVNVTKSIVTIGVSFRQTDPNADAVNFLIGIAAGKFKFCYSYDHTVSDARAAVLGTHEFSLVFQLSKPHDVSGKPMIGHLRQAF